MCNIHSNDKYLLRMRFISLSTIPVRKEYLAKINNLPNHHGAGSPEAWGPMQSHRLHWLKAGPGHEAMHHRFPVQARNQLGTQGAVKRFLRGA